MKIQFCILAISTLWIGGQAQVQQERVDYQIISKIKEEGFNRSQVMDHLFSMTDVSGPRLTGSANLKKSQEWAKKQFEDWGLANAKIEAWGGFGKGWEIQKSYVAMKTPYYQAMIGAPKAWTPGTNGLISGQAVKVKIENEQDFEKYKGSLKGKIAVMPGTAEIKLGLKPDARRYTEEELKDLYMDRHIADDDHDQPARPRYDREQIMKQRQLQQKVRTFLMEEGAIAVLSTRGGVTGTFFTSNGASYAVNAKPVLPEVEMASEHIAQIVRMVDAKKEVELEMDIKTKFFEQDTMQYNVVAEIPGTDPKLKSELVMIGAHQDSWHAATGATDNAAGCAVMMEVMRILKAIDARPRRTVRIALWSGEEQGLLGSRGYVKKHFAEPDSMALRPDHAKLSAYYNLDNGGGMVRGIYLQGNDALRPVFETWLAPFKDLDAATVTARNTGSTDHVAFDAVGLPGFQFIQDPLDYNTRTHHTNMDTYDRIQKADLMQASVVIASIVYHTAIREEKLPRKSLPKPKGKAAKQ